MSEDMNSSEICILIFIWQAFSPANIIFAGFGILFSVCILLGSFMGDIVTPVSLRQLRILEQAKILSSTSLSALKCFSDASRYTQKCHRLWQ